MPEPVAPGPDVAAKLRAGFTQACADAAEWICDADVLLLCTGAGFSADSGLGTYSTVAEMEAYKQRNLKYHDLCQVEVLRKDPELFWGFWGHCFNRYRANAPHEGYKIIDQWADRCFRSSPLAASIREEMRLLEPSGYSWTDQDHEVYHVEDLPGAFFVITSNVDAHHYDWFKACEIRECHGSVELYQCAKARSAACPGAWRAPADLHFSIDEATMLAPTLQQRSSSQGDQCAGQKRPRALHHMPPAPLDARVEQSFSSNHPRCCFCGDHARPAVFMFEDEDWHDVPSQSRRKKAWVHALLNVIGLQVGGRALRLAVLEVGAGGNVTTVRKSSEQILHGCLQAGAKAKLIRVNPEVPLGDEEYFAPDGQYGHCVISIMGGGLEALRLMDSHMKADTSGDGEILAQN